MCKTSLVLAMLLTVAGICVMLWPVVTGYRLQANTDEAVQNFLEERKPEQQYPELLAALREYNQRIYAEKQCNLVDLEACEEPAADLTTYGVADEIIGVLEIPAMELIMPVYLGASDAHLAAGKTAKSILVTASVRLAAFIFPQYAAMMQTDEMDFASMGERKRDLLRYSRQRWQHELSGQYAADAVLPAALPAGGRAVQRAAAGASARDTGRVGQRCPARQLSQGVGYLPQL